MGQVFPFKEKPPAADPKTILLILSIHVNSRGGPPKPPTIRSFPAFNYAVPWPYSGGRVEYKLPEAAMNAKTIIIGLVILAVVVSVILTCNQAG